MWFPNFVHLIQFQWFFCGADRETLIKRAQQERQKRAEIRKQNTGAIIIQSCARSFLIRSECKERERCAFDNYLQTSGLSNREQLEYLLKRILFFYYKKNQKDGERLVSAIVIVCVHSNSYSINAIFLYPIFRFADNSKSIPHPASRTIVKICCGQSAVAASNQEIAVSVHSTIVAAESIARHSVSHVGNILVGRDCCALHRRSECAACVFRRRLQLFGETKVLQIGAPFAGR